MPIIDLDHHVEAVSSGPSRRHLPVLIALAAGSLLFGLTGEPKGPTSPVDEANICSSLAARDGSSGGAVVNPDTGEIVRTIHCPL